jgi:hypothetical protein
MDTPAQLLARVQVLSSEVALLRSALQQLGDKELRATLNAIDVLVALDGTLADGSIWPNPETWVVPPGDKVHLTRTVAVDQHLVLTRIEQPGLVINLRRQNGLEAWGRDLLLTFVWCAPGECLSLTFENQGEEPVVVDTARLFGFTVRR